MKHFRLFLPEVSDFHNIKVMGRVHIRTGPAKAYSDMNIVDSFALMNV